MRRRGIKNFLKTVILPCIFPQVRRTPRLPKFSAIITGRFTSRTSRRTG